MTQKSTDFTVQCPLKIKVSYFEYRLFGYPWWRTWRAATNCMVHTNARQEPLGKLCRIVSRKCIVSILMSTNTYNIWIPPVWSIGTVKYQGYDYTCNNIQCCQCIQNLLTVLAQNTIILKSKCTRYFTGSY